MIGGAPRSSIVQQAWESKLDNQREKYVGKKKNMTRHTWSFTEGARNDRLDRCNEGWRKLGETSLFFRQPGRCRCHFRFLETVPCGNETAWKKFYSYPSRSRLARNNLHYVRYRCIRFPYNPYRHDSRDRFRVLAKPHPTTVVPSLLPNHRITSHQEKKQKTKNRSSIKKKKTVPRTLARETRERRKRNGRNVTVCPYCLCCKGAQSDEREPEEPADAAGVGVRVDRVIRGSRGGRKRWSRAR